MASLTEDHVETISPKLAYATNAGLCYRELSGDELSRISKLIDQAKEEDR